MESSTDQGAVSPLQQGNRVAISGADWTGRESVQDAGADADHTDKADASTAAGPDRVPGANARADSAFHSGSDAGSGLESDADIRV